MVKLAIVVGNSINWIIVLLAVLTFGIFARVIYQLNKLETKIAEDHNKKRRSEWTEGGFKKEPDAFTKEENLMYQEEFNAIQLDYSVADQLVPVFPLLGILGTVAGLMMQLENIDKMKDALAMSMGTTFLGLLFAIILKIVDAWVVSKALNKRAMYFENFEETYQMTRDKRMEGNDNQ